MHTQGTRQRYTCNTRIWRPRDAPETKDVVGGARDKVVRIGESGASAVDAFDDLNNLKNVVVLERYSQCNLEQQDTPCDLRRPSSPRRPLFQFETIPIRFARVVQKEPTKHLEDEE